MTKFCGNPLCKWHIDTDDCCDSLKFMLTNMTEATVRRFRIRDNFFNRQFDFCETCANVLAMVHGEPNNQTTNEKAKSKQPEES